MRYPDLLVPTTIEIIELPSGVTVQIPKTEPTFDLWKGKPISDTYGNKIVLDCDGESVFAELAILRIFQKDGWQGVEIVIKNLRESRFEQRLLGCILLER
jgi:hypothetical protein